MEQQQSFGPWLRRQRKSLDLTQEQLAQKVGCSAAAIRKFEAEERRPSAQLAERLAAVFSLPASEQASFLRFARGDWRSVPAGRIDGGPWRSSTTTPRSNLPASLTSLVGREQEVAAVHDYLSHHDRRLVTLIGPPGIGKTRLSIEASRAALSDFADGVFFVALASLADPSLIAAATLQALGYVEEKDVRASQQLVDGIGDKRVLLVIDNCEHLIDDVAPLISVLLSACPNSKVLATSRESLRVPGEWLYAVPALGVPEKNAVIDLETVSEWSALALFAERARAVRADFALDASNIQAIAAICAQLDGLPLAIELMAARIRLMSPQAMLERLDDRLVLFADGARALTARQKTLHNAISWSYDLLSSEEREMFARLSVFSGGFTLAAAESIFSRMFASPPVSDLITSLLDKSLLQQTFDARGEPRFDMLVTIRQFARNRLRRSGAEAETRDWHLAFFLDFAEIAADELHGQHQLEWMERLDGEVDNFRAALAWGVTSQYTEEVMRLLCAVRWQWWLRGDHGEVVSWFGRLKTLPDMSRYPALHARILNHLGRQSWLLQDLRHAKSLVEESRAIWLTLGDDGRRGLAEANMLLGIIARAAGNVAEAKSHLEESLALYEPTGDERGQALTMHHLGDVALDRGDDAAALYWGERSLELLRRLGDLWGMARPTWSLGRLFLKQGKYEKALEFFGQQLAVDETLAFSQGIIRALKSLGDVHLHQAQYGRAEQCYERGLAICRDHGLNLFQGSLHFSLGVVALCRKDYPKATRHFADSFHLTRLTFGERSVGELLAGMAAVAAGMHQPERAGKLYGAAQGILDSTDYRIPPLDSAELNRHIQIARDQLGETRFDALAADGRAMSVEQAIAYALEARLPQAGLDS